MAVQNISSVEEFNNFLNNGKKTLVDFYADWCGPCKMLAPVIEEVSNNNNDYNFIKVNVDNVPELAEKYAIASIPTLIIFDQDKEVKRQSGFLQKEVLTKFLQ